MVRLYLLSLVGLSASLLLVPNTLVDAMDEIGVLPPAPVSSTTSTAVTERFLQDKLSINVPALNGSDNKQNKCLALDGYNIFYPLHDANFNKKFQALLKTQLDKINEENKAQAEKRKDMRELLNQSKPKAPQTEKSTAAEAGGDVLDDSRKGDNAAGYFFRQLQSSQLHLNVDALDEYLRMITDYYLGRNDEKLVQDKAYSSAVLGVARDGTPKLATYIRELVQYLQKPETKPDAAQLTLEDQVKVLHEFITEYLVCQTVKMTPNWKSQLESILETTDEKVEEKEKKKLEAKLKDDTLGDYNLPNIPTLKVQVIARRAIDIIHNPSRRKKPGLELLADDYLESIGYTFDSEDIETSQSNE
ncbi:hypothetical protein H4R35_004496 [Dimargaris xerosporica]|nr:hypothetical protein H4R35_004496 [Dimargaris xerosporica]